MRWSAIYPVMLAIAIAPWLAAPKCIEADPVLTGEVDSGSGGVADATVTDGGGSGITPAVACPEAGTARIRIRDFEYQIQCGCMEANGKTCTIGVGTRVIWVFADSEDHDVASVGSTFPDSGQRGAGTFSNVFAAPGEYPYLCNIHAAQMNGYTIRVR